MIKIAFFDTKSYDKASFESELSNYNFEAEFFEFKLNPKSVTLTKGFDVVCCFVNDSINSEVIEALVSNGVKLIAMRCAGYNNIDLKAAFGKINIAHVPAYSPNAVAEYAMTLIMALNRKIHHSYSRVRNSNFNIAGLTGFDLKDKTIGVVGTGKIGQILIKIARGFDMNVIAYDKFPNEQAANTLRFRYVTLDEIYKESHIISLHCPLTPESFHMINCDSIAKMKENVMIINTGRGGLIDTKALIDGLKSKKIGYAGLDVYEEEGQYFFEDFSFSVIEDDLLARLLTFPNVLITSHQAFLTREALSNIASTTLANVKSFFESGKLINEICYQCGSDKASCARVKTGKCF